MKLLPVVVLAIGCHRTEEAAEPGTGICRGEWVHTTDGRAPDASGFEVRDAEGRTIETGGSSSQHVWTEWETDAAGTDRQTEIRWDSDGDDVADMVVTSGYALDERLRLVWESDSSDMFPDREITHVYDDDDQEIELWHTVDGAPEGMTFHTWEDGRRTLTENTFPDGGVMNRYTREYLAPPPSLDRIETVEGFDGTLVMRFDTDAEGRILAAWNAEGDRVLAQTWDDAGHVVDEVRAWETGPLWGDETGETHTTRLYDGHGRIVTERSEEDAGPDGTVDGFELTVWEWSCE